MPDKKVLVCGTYPNQNAVEQAVTHLQSAGFLGDNLTVLLSPKVGDAPENFGSQEKETPLGLDPNGILGLVARVLHKGKILLSVRCEGSEQALVARSIFERTDAESIISSTDSIPRSSPERNVKPNFLA